METLIQSTEIQLQELKLTSALVFAVMPASPF